MQQQGPGLWIPGDRIGQFGAVHLDLFAGYGVGHVMILCSGPRVVDPTVSGC